MSIMRLKSLPKECMINHSPVGICSAIHLLVMVFLLMVVMLRCWTAEAASEQLRWGFLLLWYEGEIEDGITYGVIFCMGLNSGLSQLLFSFFKVVNSTHILPKLTANWILKKIKKILTISKL